MTLHTTTRTTASPVPTWARRAAALAALTPVLSSLWRLPLMFGVSMGMDDAFMADMMAHAFWQRFAYLVGLGILTDGLAFLTLGLVSRWGEVWPSWIPRLGGRRIPPTVAIVPALVGGLVATLLFTVVAFRWEANVGSPFTGWGLLQTVAYAPLLLWGPLVLLVTAHYYRRRCGGEAS